MALNWWQDVLRGDVTSGAQLQELKDPYSVLPESVAFSPDGKVAAGAESVKISL